MKYRVEIAGRQHELDVELTPKGYVVKGEDGQAQLIHIEQRSDGSEHALTPWGDLPLVQAKRGEELWVDVAGRRLQARVQRVRASAGSASTAGRAGAVHAPMAGKLLQVSVAEGERVAAGQALAVIEAMKMENEILSPFAGTVKRVAVTAPSAVEKGALLLELSPS